MKRALISSFMTAGIVAMTLSAGPTSAGNTHYRWVDDRGNPVHSDRPPPAGVDYEVISTESSLVRRVNAGEGAVPPDLESKPGNEFEQVNTAPPPPVKNPEYCQRARENLETLNSSARIRMRNEEGEYYFLTEEQKGEQRRNAEAAIARYCE